MRMTGMLACKSDGKTILNSINVWVCDLCGVLTTEPIKCDGCGKIFCRHCTQVYGSLLVKVGMKEKVKTICDRCC